MFVPLSDSDSLMEGAAAESDPLPDACQKFAFTRD